MRLMTASSNRRIGFGSGWLSIVGSTVVDRVPSITRATVLERQRRGRGTLTRQANPGPVFGIDLGHSNDVTRSRSRPRPFFFLFRPTSATVPISSNLNYIYYIL
jgi:hypothetical protein